MPVVDIIVASLRKRFQYSDGEHVLLDRLIDSIERTCEAGSYDLHIADDPHENFTHAVSRLLAQTTRDVVHFDDDHLCYQPGWIDAYYRSRDLIVGQGGRPGIIIGRTYHPSDESSYRPGNLEQAGNDLTATCTPVAPHNDQPDPGIYEQHRRVAAACFGGCWISRALIDRAGGLDPALAAGCYQEDIEYSLRGWRLGFESWYTPWVACIHLGGRTKNFERMKHRCHRNISYNAAKYGSFVEEIRRRYNFTLRDWTA